MDITITNENLYFGSTIFLLILQIYQQFKLDRAKKEIKQLWDQISLFNSMVAIKLLENQKEIDKLKENKDGK